MPRYGVVASPWKNDTGQHAGCWKVGQGRATLIETRVQKGKCLEICCVTRYATAMSVNISLDIDFVLITAVQPYRLIDFLRRKLSAS